LEEAGTLYNSRSHIEISGTRSKDNRAGTAGTSTNAKAHSHVALSQRAEHAQKQSLLSTLARVAWLAIALGLLMELLLAGIRFGALGQIEPYLAELTGKIAWSFIVCTGLAVGSALSDGKPFFAGLSGLIMAPIGFVLARGLHKAAAELLETTGPAESSLITLIAGLRGLEYMALGTVIFWIGTRPWAGALAYLGVGLLAGIVFGGAVVLLAPQAAATIPGLLSLAVNELLFPVGCSLTLYVASAVGKKVVTDRAVVLQAA
jgi:hypothetical protein